MYLREFLIYTVRWLQKEGQDDFCNVVLKGSNVVGNTSLDIKIED